MKRRLKDILTLRHDAENAAAHISALMIEAQHTADNVIHGQHARRRPGSGEKFWQFRDYHPGDRPQDIDWRQSARTDHVYIREKEQQIAQKNYFWCASSPGMDYTSASHLPTKRYTAQLLSLSLAILLTRSGEQIGSYGKTSTGSSEKKLAQMAADLLEKHPDLLPPVKQFLPPRRSTLILTGDFLSAKNEIRDCLQKLTTTAENVLILQILDPSEIELNFTGRITFEGFKKQERETIQQVESVRIEYRQRIRDHIDFIFEECQQHNWRHILHRTDQSLQETLTQIWLLMDRQAGGKP